MELVPSQSGSGFAQQGTVDWTVLSQSTFSASLAILGRLSAAGLEPLTVAIAQAMCINIPIGIRGEQKLAEHMSSLKSFSGFGDAIWFGTGVRHVLRTIVQLSQGASSVALAACLSETYSIQYFAQVFYEMAKIMESPPEFTPSFSQWESFVRVSAGVFANSIFGQKVGQMARLAGFATPISSTEPSGNRAADPRELAETIYAIGKVQTGKLQSINIIGGLGCCWAMAFCDFLLGLRVRFTADNGTVLFQNFEAGRQQAQVEFQINQASSTGLQCSSQTFTLDPIRFVARWRSYGRLADSLLSTSRIKRAEIVAEVFPDLLSEVTHRSFAQLLASSGFLLSIGCRQSRYMSAKAFIEHSLDALPELQPVYALAVAECANLGEGSLNLNMESTTSRKTQNRPSAASKQDIDAWVEAGKRRVRAETEIQQDLKAAALLQVRAVTQIQAKCTCGNHPYRCSTVTACYLLISLAFLLGELIFDDDVNLSRLGLRYLFERLFAYRIQKDPASILATILVCSEGQLVTGDRLELYLRLFSGFERPDTHYLAVSQRVSAMSRNGIYCYFDILRHPFQSFTDASRIHIGRGTIRTAARTYDMILDQDEERLVRYKELIPKPIEPMANSLIEESVSLRFWYELWDGQLFESRHSSNPMLALTLGWQGSIGSWFGSTTESEMIPTTYSRGFGVPAQGTNPIDSEGKEGTAAKQNLASTGKESPKSRRQLRPRRKPNPLRRNP